MKSQHESPDSAIGSSPASGTAFCISAAMFALCLAFYVAEQHGFRIFESMRGIESAEPAVPSPLEILALLGAISLGVISGLVSVVTSIVWLVRHLRHAPDATSGDAHPRAEAERPVQNAGCQP